MLIAKFLRLSFIVSTAAAFLFPTFAAPVRPASVLVLSQREEKGRIVGSVVSAEDGSPLVGATILIQGMVLGTTTDARGNFTLKDVPAGKHLLVISMVGYRRAVESIRVPAGEEVHVRIQLQSTPVEEAPIVVTASKHEQVAQNTPVSVSVMRGKWLDDRNIVTLDRALRYVPGVVVTESQVSIRGSSGYSRGVGSRTLMLVNGVPMLTGDTGEIIWELIPVEWVDRVEVVKGAGSALYGSNAIGGVINVVTKDPSVQPVTYVRAFAGLYDSPYYPEWKWSSSHQSFGGWSLGHSRSVGKASFFASVSRTTNSGYRENDYYQRWTGFGIFRFNLTTSQTVSLLADGLLQRRGNFLFWRDLRHALQPPDEQLLQRVSSDRWTLAPMYHYVASERLLVNARLMIHSSHWEDNINNPGGVGNWATTTLLDGELQANYSSVHGMLWTFGSEFSGSRVRSNLFGNPHGWTGALYAQDEFSPSRAIRLTVGVRLDLLKQDTISTQGQINPKFGMVYTLQEGTALRLSAGSGFRVPSFGELFTTTSASGFRVIPNPRLKPERSWSFEGGANHEIPSLGVLDVAVFDNEFWDLIEAQFVQIMTNGYTDYVGRFDNVTRARVRGAEISLRTGLFRGAVTAEFAYTFLDARDLQTNDVLKYRPKHALYGSVGIHPSWWEMGVDVRYLSRVERVDEEFVKLGIVRNGDARVPIFVTDCRAVFHVTPLGFPIDVGLIVNNIFQYNYVELIGNLGPIRNYTAYLRASL